MKVITKREALLNVARRWRQQYPTNIADATKVEIGEKLLAMPIGSITEAAINAVIGNDSWTKLECDECEKDSGALVVFEAGERFINICEPCIRRGQRQLEGAETAQ